jgi:SpoVK/Ycf46/Vps4 family AAA+-type ATPase
MAEHLFEQVRPYLERREEERIAFIRSPRWIAYETALAAHRALDDLLARPQALRPPGLLLVGPYANGKTMIAERFAIAHLKEVQRAGKPQRVWVVQTREGAGLVHFYAAILHALRAPTGKTRDLVAKGEQIDRLFAELKPRILIFDEFHNALRGRGRDVEAIFAYLRRLGREHDISTVLVGEVAVYDHVVATEEMASRFALAAVPRWRYGDEFLSLLDSLEAALPLALASDLSHEAMARQLFALSEGLIGELVRIVCEAAILAVRGGAERITPSHIEALAPVPLSRRRGSPAREALL